MIRDSLNVGRIGDSMEVLSKYGTIKPPVDCTVTFAVSKAAWETRKENFYLAHTIKTLPESGVALYSSGRYRFYSEDAYLNSGMGSIVVLCILLMALLGCFLPLPGKAKPWKDERLCAVPFEFLFCFGIILLVAMEYIVNMIAWVASGEAGGVFTDYIGDIDFAMFLVMLFNLSVLTVYFFGGWYAGICARALR